MNLRPPTLEDTGALLAFFLRIPDGERTFFKERAVDRETVEALGASIEATHLIASGYLVADEPRLTRFRRVDRRTGERFAADLFARQ